MQVQTQFDRLSSWLKGQLRSAERVTVEQGSATFQVATAEYELRRMRRDLAEVALEPGAGLAALASKEPLSPMSYGKRPAGELAGTPATTTVPPAPASAPNEAGIPARGRNIETAAATKRSAKPNQTLSGRLRDGEFNAA